MLVIWQYAALIQYATWAIRFEPPYCDNSGAIRDLVAQLGRLALERLCLLIKWCVLEHLVFGCWILILFP
jgi:hypothetical protein